MHRDGTEDPALVLQIEALLGFDGRLEAIGPLAVFGHPAGEIIDQFHPTLAHDVVAVTLDEVNAYLKARSLGRMTVQTLGPKALTPPASIGG